MMRKKGVADLPRVIITPEDGLAGRLPMVLAEASQKKGPILKYIPTHYKYKGEGFVFMVGPEANRFVLHTHRDCFSHDRGWTPIIGESLGQGLLNMDDPEHAWHRKIWNPAFSRAYMERYVPIMQQVIAERTASWGEDRVVNVHDEAREIAFDVAAIALAGFKSGAEMDRVRELFYTMLHTFNKGKESWSQFKKRRKRAGRELKALLLQLINERRRQPASPFTAVDAAQGASGMGGASAEGDVLGMIVHAVGEKGALSDEQILSHLNILLVAGHETTTTLSAWSLYLLATQPDQRARVLAEVDRLLGNQPTISFSLTQQMSTLDHFVREVGRLYPPVINVPRGVLQPFDFEGYTITPGRRIRLALAATHRLPHVFANPNDFDPDRFAPPREEDKKTRYSLVTFGAGARICIGINFAQTEVKLLIAQLLRTFDFQPIQEHTPIHGGYWIARVPDGIYLRVKRR